jgi:hypothetical protein
MKGMANRRGIAGTYNPGETPIATASFVATEYEVKPLAGDSGQGCYGDVSLPGFICAAPDTGMNTGADNSPCAFTNACAPGFSCQAADMVDGCEPDTTGCCTPFCSVSGGGTCAPPEECAPFYPNEPPEGLEDVGVCMVAS